MIIIALIGFLILFVSVIAYVNSPSGKAAIAAAKAKNQKYTPSNNNSQSGTLEYAGAKHGGRTTPSRRNR